MKESSRLLVVETPITWLRFFKDSLQFHFLNSEFTIWNFSRIEEFSVYVRRYPFQALKPPFICKKRQKTDFFSEDNLVFGKVVEHFLGELRQCLSHHLVNLPFKKQNTTAFCNNLNI